MYYSKHNIYINDNNEILFDLKDCKIYKITKEFADLFDINGEIDINILNDKDIEFYHIITRKSELININNLNGFKIHVSNTCNLKCKYCYANQGNYGSDNKIMNTETAMKIINFLKDYNQKYNLEYITFFGGEPLLAIDIIDLICSSFENNNIKFLLQTNGTILNNKIIEIINKYNITITVSLDGPEEVNDFNRIDHNSKGTYKTIITNIHKINSESPNIRSIQATLSKEFISKYNKEDISDFIYENTKIPFIKVENELDYDNYFDNDDIEIEVNNFFTRIISKKYIMNNFSYNILKLFFSYSYNDFICQAGNSFLTIDVNGDVYPCQLFINDNDFLMGNINNNNIFTSIIYNNVLNKIKANSKSNFPTCQTCIARFHCYKCLGKSTKYNCNSIIHYTEFFLDKFAKLILKEKLNDICDLFSYINR